MASPRTRQQYVEAIAEARRQRDMAQRRGQWQAACEYAWEVRRLARECDAAFPPETWPGPALLAGRLP